MLEAMDRTSSKRLLGPERGEPQRSGGSPNGGANNRAADGPIPDPEVLAKPQRRRFTPAYKARIVEEAQRCTESGQIGALLRREGLYSSALTQWRRQYQSGALQALKDDKRGRKRTRDARDQQFERLQRENERLHLIRGGLRPTSVPGWAGTFLAPEERIQYIGHVPLIDSGNLHIVLIVIGGYYTGILFKWFSADLWPVGQVLENARPTAVYRSHTSQFSIGCHCLDRL
jgi:transposase